MFKGVKFSGHQFAVLSFEQSKPLGSPSGGGALVCNAESATLLRSNYVPGVYYYNPRAQQCVETFKAVEFEESEIGKDYRHGRRISHSIFSKNTTVHGYRVEDEDNHFTHIYYNKKPLYLKYITPYAGGDLWRLRI